jgi:hypothetical protein
VRDDIKKVRMERYRMDEIEGERMKGRDDIL